MKYVQTCVLAAFMLVSTAGCGSTPADALDTNVAAQSEVIDATADVGYYSEIRLNPETNLPAVAYYDLTNGDLKYAWQAAGGQWNLETIDEAGDVGKYSRLRFSSTGQPHIAYYDETREKPRYAYFNGAEWVSSQLNYARSGGIHLGLALDLNDVARISFISNAIFNLEYALYVPFAGATETKMFTVDNGTLTTGRGGNVNQTTDMHLRDVDGAQYPVIVYYQASLGLLQVAFYDPTHPQRFRGGDHDDWVYRFLDGSPAPEDDVGTYLSSHLEDNDILHVAYYDANNKKLKYARTNLLTDELFAEDVDTDGIVGQGTSIVVDENGVPTIAYYDASRNNLKAAVRSPQNGWQRFRIDPDGIVGEYPSIISLGQGRFGVSYRDAANKALKYAQFRAYLSPGQAAAVDSPSATTDAAAAPGVFVLGSD